MKKPITKIASSSLSLRSAIAFAVMASTGALAQDRNLELEEIVVTAERREASAQTTAISMQVMDAQDLAENQIFDIRDLQNEVPNLSISSSDGNDFTTLTIRGIGSTQNPNPNVVNGSSFIQDGISNNFFQGNNLNLFDIGSVEVLRGPQGTFVGSNSSGGAVVVSSARPNFDGFSGYMEGSIGNYDRMKVTGAINMPISDTLAARFAFNKEDRDSYYTIQGIQFTGYETRPLFTPGAQDDRNYRIGLLWEPTPALSVYVQVENNDQKNFGGTDQPNPEPFIDFRQPPDDPLTAVNESLGEPITFLNYSRYLDYDHPDPRTLRRIHPVQYGNVETNRYILDISYEFANGIVFNSATGFSERDNLRIGSGSSGAWEDGYERGTAGHNPQRLDTYDHEFSLVSPETGRLDWIVGLSARKTHNRLLSKSSNNRGINFGAAGILTPDGNPIYASCGYNPGVDPSITPPLACDTPMDSPYLRTESSLRVPLNHFYGLFGQFDYQLTDSVELSLGLRQNWETLDPNAFDYAESDEIEAINAAYMDAFGINRPAGVWESCNNGRYDRLSSEHLVNMQSWECRFDPGQPGAVQPFKDQELDYKVGVNWQPGDNNFIYAFYSRGHTSGGWRGPGGYANVLMLRPEIINDMELGWKGTLFDGLIQAELGGYWMDYQDMHQGVFLADDQGADVTTTNIGDSVIKGIEASMRTFIGNLGINASLAFNQSEIGQITTLDTNRLPGYADNNESGEYPQCNFAVGQVNNDPVTAADPIGTCFDYDGRLGAEPDRYVTLNGRENPASPELSYNLTIDYLFQLSNSSLRPRIQFSHTDGSWSNLLQSDPRDFLEARDTIDVSLQYIGGDYTIQGFVNNATDELYATSTGNNIQYGAPRTYGLRIRMDF